jgi:MtN3 and saliva related transmembrane protein
MAIRRHRNARIHTHFRLCCSYLNHPFIPAATIKEKNTEGISLVMYSLFTSGVLMWLVYGLFVKDAPIIVANAVTFILAIIILTLKIKYSANAK